MACEEVLGEGLRAFELRRGRGRAEARQSQLGEAVHDAGDERRLGADDRQCDVLVPRELRECLDIVGRDGDVAKFVLARRAGVARGDEHFVDARRLRAFPRQRVFATA